MNILTSTANTESIVDNENNQTSNSLYDVDNNNNTYSSNTHWRNSRSRDDEDGMRSNNPFPSGISALIQAATFQLGQLAEAASSRENVSQNVEHIKQEQSDGAASDLLAVSRGISSSNYASENIDNKDKKLQINFGEAPDIWKKSENETTPTLVPHTTVHSSSRFPEVLMTLALDPTNSDVITFLPDNKFFAIRSGTFVEDIMICVFDPPILSFEEFLRIASEWGFSTILDPSCTEISVFRHPYFMKGNWEKCACIKYGESPTSVRLHALPERSLIEYSLSDESINNTQLRSGDTRGNGANISTKEVDVNISTNSKRRLSPGFLSRRDSASSVSSQKQRTSVDNKGDSTATNAALVAQVYQESGDESEIGSGEEVCVPSETASYCNPQSHADDVRSFALAIATEKVNLQCGGSRRNSLVGSRMSNFAQDCDSETPLIDRAVTSATHTIVTDAIESLLRDETHTKETYLKHEKELSKSSLPGVIPISTMLFSPSAPRRTSTNFPVSFVEGPNSRSMIEEKPLLAHIPPSETTSDHWAQARSDIETEASLSSTGSVATDQDNKQLLPMIKSSSVEADETDFTPKVTNIQSNGGLPTVEKTGGTEPLPS